MSNGRSILKLKTSKETLDDAVVDVGVFDVLLPSRFFSITHKVAELGRVSMTTEYLLRLLSAVDGIDEEQVKEFFAFDLREMAFVLAEAEANDYVVRTNGRLWLTSTGRGLFRDGSAEPQIFDVEKRTERVGLDLFALAPQERESLSRFEGCLPELQPKDVAAISNASERVPEAFRRHYTELATRRDKDGLKKRALYSVDNVTAGDRFSSIVNIVARSSASRPDFPEPDLSGWQPGRDLDDRAAVVESVVEFLAALKVENRLETPEAYGTLLQLAPEFLKEFTRRDGLAVDRFYREAVARAGEFRIDRPTIPLLGPLFTRENNKRLGDALGYASKNLGDRPGEFLWVIPDVAWGMTRVLPLTLEMIRRHVAATDDEVSAVRALAVHPRRRERHIEEAFSVVDTTGYDLQAELELLLIPKMLMAALVHAPLRARGAFPVPLGIMSFDLDTVSRTEDFLRKRLPSRNEAESSLPDYQRILLARPQE
jgi:hypothetical protein